MSKSRDFERAGISLIEFYRNNPVIAAEDLLNVDLDIVQAYVLEDMWFRPYVITSAGRGVGKSFLLSVVATLRCLLFPGERVGIISSSFRQAKNTFMEVKRRWDGSPIVKQAVNRRPIFASDRCYVEFNAPKDRQSSLIEALPIGSGEKIRGSRFFTILMDEYAFVPADIVNTVITPMAATSANPMERVRRLERIKKLKAGGMSDEDLLLYDDSVNKLIGTTSAYFTFNHVYDRIEVFRDEIRKGSKKHALHFISYEDMSEGFIDLDNVLLAKASSPQILFDMEYRAVWSADSDGVFKASLIEAAKEGGCGIRVKGLPEKKYIMGVDPARSSDAFAICIIEIGPPANLVYAKKMMKKKFPEMADIIHDLSNIFDVSEIHMDAGAGGGGLALKDIVADPDKYGSNAIHDIDDQEYLEMPGRKILRMFNPSPKTNAEAVYASVSLLEHKNLRLQGPPRAGKEEEDIIYDDLVELYKQLMSISISENRSGGAHFDVQGGSSHGGAKKDLYSAFILAGKSLYDTIYHIQEESMLHSLGGLVVPRKNAWGYFK